MYGKDAECPEKWKQWLKDSGFLPQELMWNGPEDYLRYRPANVGSSAKNRSTGC